MNDLWRDDDAGADDIAQLVYLSNLIGADVDLVQPGGGNTSVKLAENDIFGEQIEALVVKGSGTDLRTITAAGFTHLSGDRLATLRGRGSMSDEEMMTVMRACMLFPDRDPVPSVETPLHSIIPHRFVAHTHDVATLSLSDTPSAREHVERVYGADVAFLEYLRPGFPLAKGMAERYAGGLPKGATGLVMEKHGLTAWGDTAKECYANLLSIISRAEEYLAGHDKRSFGGAAPARDEAGRREAAAKLAPIIRGELIRAGSWRSVLAFDGSPEVLEAVSSEEFAELTARGVMTPEHIMRAGRRPLVLPVEAIPTAVGAQRPGNRGDDASSAQDSASQPTSGNAGAAPLPDEHPLRRAGVLRGQGPAQRARRRDLLPGDAAGDRRRRGDRDVRVAVGRRRLRDGVLAAGAPQDRDRPQGDEAAGRKDRAGDRRGERHRPGDGDSLRGRGRARDSGRPRPRRSAEHSGRDRRTIT